MTTKRRIHCIVCDKGTYRLRVTDPCPKCGNKPKPYRTWAQGTAVWGNNVIANAHMTPQLHARIIAVAHYHEVSRSQAIRDLIELGLQKWVEIGRTVPLMKISARHVPTRPTGLTPTNVKPGRVYRRAKKCAH